MTISVIKTAINMGLEKKKKDRKKLYKKLRNHPYEKRSKD